MEFPVVEINEGKIRGSSRTNLDGGKFYTFLGIPYAKPPIGELRFKAPEPIEPWSGMKDVTKEGDHCYQRNEYTFVLEGSEAGCLHLNVYTKSLPSEEKKLKPVMVWIYGGAFLNGTNSPSLYGPEYLMTEDIVLVAVNYRVGFLGFMHLNDQSLDVPGNAGLKDQQLALKWVQRNIKNFNGDPNNVTIFGESAGGASVHYHIVSSSSKGLFHKAICQSGSVLCPWALAKDIALQFAQSIKKDIKTEKEALQLLRSISVEELHSYQEKFVDLNGFWSLVAPNIEYPNKTAFLTAPPAQLISSGQYNNVPLMMGYTSREGLLFVAYNNLKIKAGIEPKEMELETLIHPQMNLQKDDPKIQFIIQKYKDLYFRGGNDKDNKVALYSDFFFVPCVIGSAKLHAKTSSNPVYLYRMSLDAGLNLFKILTNTSDSGTCHADDLGYLFYIALVADHLKRGPVEDKAIKHFVKLWTNFAKFGNPTPPNNDLSITWKPVSEKEINFLDIGEELSLQSNPKAERLSTWKEIFQLSPNTADYL